MTLSDNLDRFRGALSGCRLVSFGDLGSGLALRTSSADATPPRQERLDAMFREAAQGFEVFDACDAPSSTEGAAVIVARRDELRLYLRSGHRQSDLLCCVLTDTAAIAPAAAAARLFFDLLEAAEP